jgi:hypothetical protein
MFDMARANRVSIINALRATIETLEQDSDISDGDTDLAALKIILVRRIAELEREDGAVAIPEAPK